MTPKEKAKALVEKYHLDVTMNLNLVDGGKNRATIAALIAVDEILADIKRWNRDVEVIENDEVDNPLMFWISVKIEIKHL